MKPKNIEAAVAIASSLISEQEASYIARGRTLKPLSDAELAVLMKAAIAEWVENPFTELKPTLMDDVSSELALRNLSYEYDEVDTALFDQGVRKLQARQDAFNDDEQANRRKGFEEMHRAVLGARKH